jgi:uncharacterized membrane protein (DUF485 family)
VCRTFMLSKQFMAIPITYSRISIGIQIGVGLFQVQIVNTRS